MPHAWGYASDKRTRDENQDSYGLFEVPLGLLAVVCDGMGGHLGGAVASAIAVKVIHDEMSGALSSPGDALKTALEAANTAVYDRARRSRKLMGMGTTAVAALLTDDALYVAHVGDSRAYFARGGEAESITRDHTMVNLFVDAELLSPEDAASHPEAHILARSLGSERMVEVDVQDPLPFADGDTLMLCSDGVHGFISDAEIGQQDWDSPQVAIEEVFRMLRHRDSDDNATMVVVARGASGGSVRLPMTEVPFVPEDDQEDGSPLSSVPSRASNPTILPEEPESAPAEDEYTHGSMGTAPSSVEYEDIPLMAPMNIEIGLSEDSASFQTDQIRFTGEQVPQPIEAPPEAPRRQADQDDGTQRRRLLVGAAMLLVGVSVLAIGGLQIARSNMAQSRQAQISVAQQGVVKQVPGVAQVEVTSSDLTPSEPVAAEPSAAAPDTAEPSEKAADEAPTGAGSAIAEGTETEGAVIPVPGIAAEVPPEEEGLADGAVTPSADDAVNVEEAAPAVPAEEATPTVQPEMPEVTDGVAWMAPRVSWQPEFGPEDAGFVIAVIPPPSDNGGFYIRVNKPELGRIGMHRAETYVNVPPGGTTQMEIVRKARGGECGEANQKLRTAMKLSIDYASLYSQIWSCYNISHQNHIYSVAITGVEAYEEDLWRLEGDRNTAGYSSTPWAAPAPNGLDHRLEQWSMTEEEHSFPIVMLDLIGPDQAAMDLAGDLSITAEAAAAFSRIESPTNQEIQHWARRVYVTSKALSASPGEMVQEHQPETHNRIETVLDNATYGAYLGNPTKRLPAPVRSALLAGTGIEPVKVYPLGQKPVRVKPKTTQAPPEPVPEPEPEDARPVIYHGPGSR